MKKISLQKYILKYLFAFFLIIFVINKIFLTSKKKIIREFEQKKKIFSFWEPRRKIPEYLLLCIKTWKKYLPEYEINIFDYKNIRYYLGETLFSNIICKKLPLPIQADAIRVALLKRFGGIWMDADTIITNGEFLKPLENYELVMLGEEEVKQQNIGFIFASKHSSIINEWLKEIIKRINIYKQINHNLKKKRKKFKVKWNYLGNDIIDKLTKNTTDKKFFRLDRNKMNAFPEKKFFERSSLDTIQKYQQFYFQKGESISILNNSKGIILLQNSWTPIEYKMMSQKVFLEKNILLSRLLAEILNNSL